MFPSDVVYDRPKLTPEAFQIMLQFFELFDQCGIGRACGHPLYPTLTVIDDALQLREQSLADARYHEPLFQWDVRHLLKGGMSPLELCQDRRPQATGTTL